jgi:hypothetical protein
MADESQASIPFLKGGYGGQSGSADEQNRGPIISVRLASDPDHPDQDMTKVRV